MKISSLLSLSILILSCVEVGAATPGVTTNEIVLGQSAAFSGPAEELGNAMREGALMHFDEINRQGGVHGRKIRLISLDDGYEPERTTQNTRKLIEQDKVFALLGYVGTQTSYAAMPIFTEAKVPFFGAFTGAQGLRTPFNRYIFNIRASYFDETERLVDFMVSQRKLRIAVFYQDDAYGKAGLEGVQRAMDKRQLKIVALGTVQRNTVDISAAVKSINATRPDVIDQMISAIFTGRISAGGKLPSERALAQAFGVGRQALREAVQKLQGMGLLEVRKPQGTLVRELSADVLRSSLTRIFDGDVGSFIRFLDIRKWMEAMTATEAAQHGATADDIARIDATLPRLRRAASEDDREGLDEADVAFHMAIVAATHNGPLVHLVDTFGDIMWASHGLRLAVLRAQNLQTVCEEHAAISEAIRGRAPERARDAMLHHIEMIRRRVERTYGQGAAAPADTSRPPEP